MRFPTKIKNLNDTTITFELLPYQRKWLEEYKDKELTVTVTDKKDRSLLQNAKLWALIHEIDKSINGYSSNEGEMDLYMQLIEESNIKPEYIMILPEAVERFKSTSDFRVIKEIDKRKHGNKEMVILKCFPGTSKFNTLEMSDFIETILRFATEENINITDYKELK